jgi:hypothetical protein
MSCEPITGCVIEDSTFANKARLVDTEEVALLQADIATITWKCWDSAGVLVGSGSLVVATAITDTLLTTGWDADSIGYNFKHTVGDDVCVVAGVHSFEYCDAHRWPVVRHASIHAGRARGIDELGPPAGFGSLSGNQDQER